MDLNLMTSGNTTIPTTPRHAREGLGRGFMLALAAHAVLLVGLAIGVNWKTQEPLASGVQAELWGKVPQAAAARPVVLPPVETPPAPEPAHTKIKPPPAQPKPTPAVPDAQIALKKQPKVEKQTPVEDTPERALQQEKAQEKELKKAAQIEKKQLDDAKSEKAAEKAREQQKAKLAAAAAKAERLDDLEKKQQQETTLSAQREANLKRMRGQAEGEGSADEGGSAQRSSGPSAGYAGRIKARIKPNVTFTDPIDGNPRAVVEVRLSADGHIISSRIIQSSGVPSWDNAVLRAVEKTEVLPRDTDGRVPERMELAFRPSES
jgi:colicin import membrane protein